MAEAKNPAPNRPRSGPVLLILLAAMAAGPLFNYGISVSSPLLIEEFDMTAGELGRIVTVCFAAAATFSLVLGKAADVLSTRAQMALIFLSSAFALIIAAFSQSYWLLVVAAVFCGIPQAISNPTTNRVIMAQAPLEQRTSWIGVKQSGVQAGQLFAGLFFPSVALALGWTGAALGAAIVCGLVWLLSLQVIPSTRKRRRTPSSSSQHSDTSTEPTPRLPFAVYLFALAAFLAGFGMQATNVYLPLFAVEEANFSLLAAGALSAVCGIVGVAFRIWWSRRMQAGWKPSTLLYFICAGALLAVGIFVVAGAWHTSWILWIGAVAHGMTVLGANVVINAGIMRVVSDRKIGLASGINSMGMYAGFALGPLLMGWTHDVTGAFSLGWGLVAASYILCILTALGLQLQNKKKA